LLQEIAARGDPRRGEEVFRRESLQCLKCHAIAGGGGEVGPDLISIGASAQVDYIVDSILDPSKQIKEGFHTLIVQKDDGTMVSGTVANKNEKELRIRDSSGALVVIPMSAVAAQKQSPISLMPADLAKSLRRNEFVDLIRFMSELGKEGPFKAPTARLVRRWKVLTPTADAKGLLTRIGRQALVEGVSDLDWKPGYSTVAGELPVADAPTLAGAGGEQFGFVRFVVQVTTGGEIGFQFGDPVGLRLWVDKVERPLAELAKVTLSKEAHILTIEIDKRKRTAPLRVELVDVEGSPGRAQFPVGQ
jgi:putative heme-binding domain-containing protein